MNATAEAVYAIQVYADSALTEYHGCYMAPLTNDDEGAAVVSRLAAVGCGICNDERNRPARAFFFEEELEAAIDRVRDLHPGAHVMAEAVTA